MEYTLFNQSGKAVASASSIAELDITARFGGFKFYFITNSKNKVLINELKGRPLPKRTSRGTCYA